MARRIKAQDRALGLLVVLGLLIGVPIYIVMSIGEAIGWPILIAGTTALIVAYIWYPAAQSKAAERARLAALEARRAQLLAKYTDEHIVVRIVNNEVWQGQTDEQLRDSLGAPVDTDERVMKRCRREIWKYHQTGRNRFALRITLENGVVVGWDEKM